MPRIKDKEAEIDGLLAVAKAMAVAARTAPKARGVDAVETLIIFGEDIEILAETMEKRVSGDAVPEAFHRDTAGIRKSQAVLLIGLRDLGPKKIEKPLNCGACGHGDCAGFLKAERKEGKEFPGPVCLLQSLDLGIALSSASSVAARFYVDNRIMYTAGGPTRELGWMESQIIIGIPLSCSGKNIYFDRT